MNPSQTHRGYLVVLMLVLAACLAGPAVADERLVFGSFTNVGNAENWASRMSSLLNVAVLVQTSAAVDGSTTYRVVTVPLDEATGSRVRRAADSRQLQYWRLLDVEQAAIAQQESDRAVRDGPAPVRAPNPQKRATTPPPVRPAETLRQLPSEQDAVIQMLDVDLGAQARTFFEEGLDGQSRLHGSLSIQLDYYRAWDDERQSFTFSPFYRYDFEDDQRTHFDIREGFWSLVGNDWDLHLGVRQIFWGVTEFNHLVDIINQTDLVEDIDGEEKLGQPMAQLSLVRDWGILDFFLLTGFRERTFPGPDGRPRFYIPVDTDDPGYETYDHQVDGAIRWSHHIGGFEFGLSHFTGTSRDPLFESVISNETGAQLLRPYYPDIDQTGLDAQAIYGDWAFKLEAINRTNFPDRYYAFNAGFERTLVGSFGSRIDLGIVVEYMYDDRGDDAFDTFFEHDLALATRWQFNDLGDSQALFGVIWDHENHETILTLEASRRLGQSWTLLLEGRAFNGAGALNPADISDPVNKGASVARDDYIELELTKYF